MESPSEGSTRCWPETSRLPPQTGAVGCSVRRNQAGPEAVSCLSTFLPPEEGEDQKAAANSETSAPLPEASETERLLGTVERPTPLQSPVSLRTRDTGRRHTCGKEGRQSWPPESRAEAEAAHMVAPIRESSSGVSASEAAPKAAREVLAEDRGTPGKGQEGLLPKASEATVCANNSKVSSTGEKVVLWTRWVPVGLVTDVRAQPQTLELTTLHAFQGGRPSDSHHVPGAGGTASHLQRHFSAAGK